MISGRRTRKPIRIDLVCGTLEPNVIPEFFKGSWQPHPEDLVGTEFSYLWCSLSDGSGESISLQLEDFLKAHAVCPGCGTKAAIFFDDYYCDCGAPGYINCDFSLLILGEENDRVFSAVFERSRKGEVAIRRNNHKGYLPKGLSDALLQVQAFRCYYCVAPIERTRNAVDHQAHVDHLDPYETSYLSNLVCSCRRCNLNKGRLDADLFAKSVAESLHPEALAERKALWTSIKRWRHTKAGKLWTTKLESVCPGL